MREPREPPADPRAAFRVVTTVKPDGRLIHYYEWPDQPTPGERQAMKPSRPRRPRV